MNQMNYGNFSVSLNVAKRYFESIINIFFRTKKRKGNNICKIVFLRKGKGRIREVGITAQKALQSGFRTLSM